MLACRELLPVLDLGPPTAIDETRDELLEEIRKLVSSARSVVASLPPPLQVSSPWHRNQ